jgi:hypothetical protein
MLEVKERLILYNLHTDHVMMWSELKDLNADRIVRSKCRVVCGTTAPIAIVWDNMRKSPWQRSSSGLGPDPDLTREYGPVANSQSRCIQFLRYLHMLHWNILNTVWCEYCDRKWTVISTVASAPEWNPIAFNFILSYLRENVVDIRVDPSLCGVNLDSLATEYIGLSLTFESLCWALCCSLEHEWRE